MICLMSFIHREEVRSLLARWLSGELDPLDAARIKSLVNFNSLVVRRARERFATILLPDVVGTGLEPVAVTTKGQLKDLLVGAVEKRPQAYSDRVRECVEAYRRRPGHYYRETPIEGMVYVKPGDGLFRAASRIKRVRRISDKCSRRIIRAVVKCLEARGAAGGAETEELVIAEIRSGHSAAFDTPLPIHDIIGFKLVDEGGLEDRLLRWIDGRDDVVVVRRRRHRGRFNATNYVLQWRHPRVAMAATPLSPETERVLRARGMGGDLAGGLARFIESGEEELNLEIIVQRFEEVVESEIGRSLHEERVIRQRRANGRHRELARNITTLTQYLFYFALSRRTRIARIPVLPWVHYMPDTLEQVLLSLTDFPAGELGLVP